MNKSLKAFLMGYVYFKVETTNDCQYFFLYNSAHKAKPEIGNVSFLGYHLPSLGWRGFFYRYDSTIDWPKYVEKLRSAKF